MNKKIPILAVLVLGTLCAGCAGDTDDFAHYVTLGSIDDLNPEFEETTITDEDVADAMKEELEADADYVKSDDPIDTGDYVMINMYVTSGSEVLYDYTGDEYYDMVVGDNDWGEGFDEFLVGKSAGDSGVFECSYDSDFDDMNLAGRDVTIEYEIAEVDDIVSPDMAEYIKEAGYENEEEFKESVRESLIEDAAEEDKESYRTALMEALIDISQFKDYPSSLKKEAKEVVESGYLSYADMFGMSLDELKEAFGITDEDIASEEEFYAKQMIALDALIKEYDITLSDEEYKKRLDDYAAEEEYDSADELLEDVTEDEMREYFLQQMAYELLESRNPLP